jgi:hypothetical protein
MGILFVENNLFLMMTSRGKYCWREGKILGVPLCRWVLGT